MIVNKSADGFFVIVETAPIKLLIIFLKNSKVEYSSDLGPGNRRSRFKLPLQLGFVLGGP